VVNNNGKAGKSRGNFCDLIKLKMSHPDIEAMPACSEVCYASALQPKRLLDKRPSTKVSLCHQNDTSAARFNSISHSVVKHASTV